MDIATLTGACVIALGGVRSGLYANRDELAHALHQAGEASLDPCWRMPLDDEYAEGLKSNLPTWATWLGGRVAPSPQPSSCKICGRLAMGALDIAGTAWKGAQPKGSTGRPVGLLLQYLLAHASNAAATAKSSPPPQRAPRLSKPCGGHLLPSKKR